MLMKPFMIIIFLWHFEVLGKSRFSKSLKHHLQKKCFVTLVACEWENLGLKIRSYLVTDSCNWLFENRTRVLFLETKLWPIKILLRSEILQQFFFCQFSNFCWSRFTPNGGKKKAIGCNDGEKDAQLSFPISIRGEKELNPFRKL